MDLSQVREILNKAGFSEESMRVMNEIIDEAIKSGFITQEAKEKLLAIVDLEAEAANVEADAMEEVALALESFADELERASDKAGEELKLADGGLLEDIKGAVHEANKETTPS